VNVRNCNEPKVTEDAARLCYHCHEPIPDGTHIVASIQDSHEAFCCHGCRTIAELIVGAGLDDYYTFRTAPGASGAAAATHHDEWIAYDREPMLSEHSTQSGSLRSATIGLNGIGCAACGWLIDRMLRRESPIVDVKVNVATARVSVQWRAPFHFSSVLGLLATLGYRPYVLDAKGVESALQDEYRLALKRLAVSGLGMMQVMMFAVALYVGDTPAAEQAMDSLSREYLRIISLFCTLPVLLYSGKPILLNGWRAVTARAVVMDVPVSIALILAFAASVFNTWRGSGDVYFDSVVMFVFFLTLGRFVEMRARHRTHNVTDALARLLPRTARRVRSEDRYEQVDEVSITELAIDDEILVRAGDVIAADGWVVAGDTHIDESMLTGEALPVARSVGASVSAGTLNTRSPIRVRIAALDQSTVLSSIVRLLRDAESTRHSNPTPADRAAAWFLTRILFAAALVAGAWLILDPTKAFEATLAVLVVTCPCALSLALPTALAAATATLAKRGVLVIKSTALETLSQITAIVFDKTGTLTRGRPEIVATQVYGDRSAEQCLALATALERHSEHPLAGAFKSRNGELAAVAVAVVAGAGIEGTIDSLRLRLGRRSFAAGINEATNNSYDQTDEAIYLGDGARALASFRIADPLREEAPGVIESLRARGIDCEISSGDAATAVVSAAERCGIERYQYRQSPADKLAYVRSLTAGGAVVAMVGDGINDAPVLAGASVSLAMGRASALAHASADLLLVGDTLNAVPYLIEVARRTRRIVRQNLAWAAAYNFIALPLAALGFVPPWLAAVGMSLSSILVVLNAMRLAPRKHDARPATPTTVVAHRAANAT
jgi:Cu2+-exporting ATPase